MQTFKKLPTMQPRAKKTTDQKWNGTAAYGLVSGIGEYRNAECGIQHSECRGVGRRVRSAVITHECEIQRREIGNLRFQINFFRKRFVRERGASFPGAASDDTRFPA